MQKEIKSYVEKIYSGKFSNNCVTEEVEERDPMRIINDGKIKGFRFYDKEYIIDKDICFYGKKINISGWIYFGKKISFDKIKRRYSGNKKYQDLINIMENNHYSYLCYTQSGSFIGMNEEDKLFEEVVNKDKVKVLN